MKLSVKATKLICQIDHELRACNCAMECGKGESFISRSTMMENAIKAADDVSDWVYVHSQLLKFQAEHIATVRLNLLYQSKKKITLVVFSFYVQL